MRAQLWHPAEYCNSATPQIANVRRLLGSEIAKGRLLPATAGVTGDFKTVKQEDLHATNQIIVLRVTRIAALMNEPRRRFLEIDKTMIITNGGIFEHLPPRDDVPHLAV